MAVDVTGAAVAWSDLPEKLSAVAALGRARGADTVVLSDPANLTWLLGARVNVPQTLDTACLDVVVHVEATPRITVVTNRIEAPRLQDVELAGLDADWSVVEWWDTRQDRLPAGAATVGDRVTGDANVATDLALLRRTLTGRQIARLREVSHDTAAAATAAVDGLHPGVSEYAAAGIFAGELLSRGLDPVVLLVSGEDHLGVHRHPLPTQAALGRRAMLVACGRRHGLVASVTRIVAFDTLTNTDHEAYQRLLHVEEAFLDATRPGARLGDIVVRGTDAYAAQGFDPLEWHRHHQGGFSGWQPREFPAQASSDAVVPVNGVVAWNPSAGPWKVEDTTLVTPGGCEPLVHDDAWPAVDIGGRTRPDVLAV